MAETCLIAVQVRTFQGTFYRSLYRRESFLDVPGAVVRRRSHRHPSSLAVNWTRFN